MALWSQEFFSGHVPTKWKEEHQTGHFLHKQKYEVKYLNCLQNVVVYSDKNSNLFSFDYFDILMTLCLCVPVFAYIMFVCM